MYILYMFLKNNHDFISFRLFFLIIPHVSPNICYIIFLFVSMPGVILSAGIFCFSIIIYVFWPRILY